MATIVKTKAGSWKAIVRRCGWPLKVKTFRLRRDAENWARDTEGAIVDGTYDSGTDTAGRLTVAKALERYAREISPTKRPSTRDRESFRIKQIAAQLGQYRLATLNKSIIAQYRDDRLASGMSASAVRLELALLGHLYGVAMREWGLGLTHNPVAAIKKPAPAPGRTRRFTGDEEQRLMTSVRAHSNPLFAWVVELALVTAMRKGEILGLRQDNVDLKRKVVRLTMSKNGSARTVPLSRRAAKIIEETLAYRARPKDTDLIFFGEPGKDGVRRPYVIGKIWQQALVRAGIRDLHFHDLRHEAASRLVERGLSDQEVAAITGHK